MKELQKVVMNPDSVLVEDIMVKFNVDEEEAQRMREAYLSSEMFVNDEYQVLTTIHRPAEPGWPPFVHLDITRSDREEIQGWSDLQEIKNQLVGPEYEGVEIYPAESRLVDMGPARHLWVFIEKFHIPMGWTTRMVKGES